MYVGMSSIVYGKIIQKNHMLKCVGSPNMRMLKNQFWDIETKCGFELPPGILNSVFISPVKTDL